jgi:hypothetical protein
MINDSKDYDNCSNSLLTDLEPTTTRPKSSIALQIIKLNEHMMSNRIKHFVIPVIAIAIGLLFSPFSRQYPLFHWLFYLKPHLIGLLPSTTPQPWGFTFEQLQQVDLTGQVALVTG